MSTAVSDIRVENQGSLIQFFVLTPEARAWVAENVILEGWQWLGNSFAVEGRYAGPLIDGLEEAGLIVEN